MHEDHVKTINIAVLCGIMWGMPIVTGIFWLLIKYSPPPARNR